MSRCQHLGRPGCPGTAAGQTECLSSATEGVHVVHMYIYFLLKHFHPDKSESEKRMRPLVPFGFVSAVFCLCSSV